MQTADVATRPELYCVVPRELGSELVSELQTALATHGIKVILERRDLDAPVSYEQRRQRALHLPRRLPELPAELAEWAEGLELVQRMPSPGLVFADATLPQVVAAARTGDAIASSELVWRLHARVTARLTQRHGSVAGHAMGDSAMGALLDAVDGCSAQSEAEVLMWADRVVDRL